MRRFWIALAALALSACASLSGKTSESATLRPVTILVSIDGFRADYLNRGVTPTLSRLAAEGVRAKAMIPAFPTVTFPNHYTLATGKRPDHNGILGNAMRDPALPGRTFRAGRLPENTAPVWWTQAEPIWITAKKQGKRVAPFFWPGAETDFGGVRPDYWIPFEQSLTSRARANILLGWLSVEKRARPNFATLYFDVVDENGHKHGPDSPEVNAAIADVDSAIGAVVDGLKARGIAANLVIVSDHGMAAISPERVVFLDDIAPAANLDPIYMGGYAALELKGENAAAAARAALTAAHDHIACWPKGSVPARFDFGANRRAPAIACLAETGWTISTRATFKPDYARGGAHGYDPRAPEMAALFIAAGPSIKAGAALPDIHNVDVYPLLAALVGVKPEPNQGDRSVARLTLK